MSLWTTRKATETTTVYSLPQNLKTIGNIQRPFSAKYDESPIHQSSYYTSKASAFVTDLRPSNYLLNAPSYISMSSTSPITTHTYQNNQSLYREVPLTSTAIAENSIISSNYRERALASSPAVEIEPSSYPSYNNVLHPQMLRYDFTTTQMPMVYPHNAPDDNNMNKKSFYPSSHDNAINIGDMNQPPTINSIYSHTDLQQPAPQLPLDEKSSLLSSSSFQSIYNQPQEYHHNYNSDRNMKMSKAYHDKPLIKPIGVSSVVSSALTAATDFIPQQKIPMSFENRLNNDNPQQLFNPENSIHMSDVDTDDSSDVEKMTFAYKKLDVPQATNNVFDIKFSDTNVQQSCENMATIGSSSSSSDIKHSNTTSINETTPVLIAGPNDDGNIMHQVWERVIEAEPTPIETASQHSSFVIPKIIVETQIDLTESTIKGTGTFGAIELESTEITTMDVDEKQDRDIPEKLLNQTSYEMEKHSADNQQYESIPSSSASVSYDNLPLTDTKMSIYHYDKQPTDTNEQQPQSSVEYELRNFDDIKISSSLSDDGSSSNVITCESEMKGNNSFAEGNTAPLQPPPTTTKKVNNINDDKNLKSSPSTSTSSSMALNDKIGEIYRKIEKIEGEYYGEKGKIMENFEMRRLSAASLSDEAKIDVAQPMVNKNDDSSKISSLGPQEFNQNENDEREFGVMDKRQHVGADDDDAVVDIDKNDKNLVSQNEWESNQSEYAVVNTDGIQKSSYESQMDSQSNYNYYHQQNQSLNDSGETQQIDTNFQQQQPVEFLENPQYTQMHEQNQQSVFENQEYAVPTSSFEDASGNNNNNSAGDYQTSSVQQYSYEPSVQYQQNDPGVRHLCKF